MILFVCKAERVYELHVYVSVNVSVNLNNLKLKNKLYCIKRSDDMYLGVPIFLFFIS